MPIPLFGYQQVRRQPGTTLRPTKLHDSIADRFMAAYQQGVGEVGEDRRLDKRITAAAAEGENDRAFRRQLAAEQRGSLLTPEMELSFIRQGFNAAPYTFVDPQGKKRIDYRGLGEYQTEVDENELVTISRDPETGEEVQVPRSEIAARRDAGTIKELIPTEGTPLPAGTAEWFSPAFRPAVSNILGRLSEPDNQFDYDTAMGELRLISSLEQIQAARLQAMSYGRTNSPSPVQPKEVEDFLRTRKVEMLAFDENGDPVVGPDGDYLTTPVSDEDAWNVSLAVLQNTRNYNPQAIAQISRMFRIGERRPAVEFFTSLSEDANELGKSGSQIDVFNDWQNRFMPMLQGRPEVMERFQEHFGVKNFSDGEQVGPFVERLQASPLLRDVYTLYTRVNGAADFQSWIDDAPHGLDSFRAAGFDPMALGVLAELDPQLWGQQALATTAALPGTERRSLASSPTTYTAVGTGSAALLGFLGIGGEVPAEPVTNTQYVSAFTDALVTSSLAGADADAKFKLVEDLAELTATGDAASIRARLDEAYTAGVGQLESEGGDPASAPLWGMLAELYQSLDSETPEGEVLDLTTLSAILTQTLRDARFELTRRQLELADDELTEPVQ